MTTQSLIERVSRHSFKKINISDRPNLDQANSEHRPEPMIYLAAKSYVNQSIDGSGRLVRAKIKIIYSLLVVARNYLQTLNGLLKKNFVLDPVFSHAARRIEGHLSRMSR